MKIVSPFSKKEEVIPLIEAGADELYCGIIPDKYCKKYSYTLNRRPWYSANFDSFSELRKALQIAHSKGVKVYVAMNGLYTQEQYPLIWEIVKKLNQIELDGFIIADIGVLLFLRERNVRKQIHMGTGGTAFNSKTTSFYKRLGVRRVILPRHLTVDEIETIVGNSNQVELEVFILYEPCPYVDGFCTFHAPDTTKEIEQPTVIHNRNISSIVSCLPYSDCGCTFVDFPKLVLNDKTGKRIRTSKKNFPPLDCNDLICGACAIYNFNKKGISALKIAGRGKSTDLKIKGTRFIREVLEHLKTNDKRRFIKDTQRLYCKTYNIRRCSGFNCYYPSVFN